MFSFLSGNCDSNKINELVSNIIVLFDQYEQLLIKEKSYVRDLTGPEDILRLLQKIDESFTSIKRLLPSQSAFNLAPCKLVDINVYAIDKCKEILSYRRTEISQEKYDKYISILNFMISKIQQLPPISHEQYMHLAMNTAGKPLLRDS